jgi:hypothetical protein
MSEKQDRQLVCQSLAKQEGEKVAPFFIYLLTGKSRIDFGPVGRPDEELRIFALEYLSRNLRPDVISGLEEYLEAQRKNLLSRFKKDPLEQRIHHLISSHKANSFLPSSS